MSAPAVRSTTCRFAPCSSSPRRAIATTASAHVRSSRGAQLRPLRANADDKDSNPFLSNDSAPSSSASSSGAGDERIERVERAIKGKRRGNTATKVRPIAIRGVDPPQQVSTEFAPWKEGQLFPEGWERMSGSEKMRELYMGQRGVLFWINKLAYGAAIAMLAGWVIFRFVGPNLGLYQLAGDMMTPGV